jgi:hypothetical protein
MSEGQPHAKYPHVFAVVRIDTYEGIDEALDEDRLAVTGVVTTEEAADADASRVNALAKERGTGSRYITFVSRLKG